MVENAQLLREVTRFCYVVGDYSKDGEREVVRSLLQDIGDEISRRESIKLLTQRVHELSDEVFEPERLEERARGVK